MATRECLSLPRKRDRCFRAAPITFLQFTLRRCCVWKVGMTPANKTDISQPGSKSSMTKRSCKDVTCSNGVDPCKPKNNLLRGE